MDAEHVEELLPGHAAGTLTRGEDEHVAAHLTGCGRCRAQAAQWRAIAAGTAALATAVGDPSQDLLARVLARLPAADADRAGAVTCSLPTAQAARTRPSGPPAASARARPTVGPVPVPVPVRPGRPRSVTPAGSASPRGLWQLVVRQVPLVGSGLWLAAPLVLAAGTGTALAAILSGEPGASALAALVLSLCAPAVAAVGVALVYGPETDPGLELALSTPTPPRLVLLARLALVVGYDLGLALLANALVAAVDPTLSFWPLVSLWLGPMAVLSAGSLLLSLVAGPTAAIAVALTVWSIQLLAFGPARDAGVVRALADIWELALTGPGAGLAAAGLAAAALWLAPRREPA